MPRRGCYPDHHLALCREAETAHTTCLLGAVLSNDHKALTSQMEQLLHQLHAQSRDAGRPAAQSLVSTAAAEPEPAVAAAAAASSQPPSTNGPARLPAQPFAVVDEVSTGSPASSAGIQLGDQLCAFGSATASSRPSPLQAVAAELQTNVGRPVQATFLRAGAPVELTLTPQPWGGRGLLGCHLRPL